MHHKTRLIGKVAAPTSIAATQAVPDSQVGGLDKLAAPPKLFAASVLDTTLVAALALVLVVPRSSVRVGAVGAIVVEGNIMPEGPNEIVVPSTTALVMVLSAPAPIL